ncbi:MAG TPA: ATP-binding protein [Gaiellaceae bacterium]|nr:ATP-binding protein [Gaiellaceae bacterium]
MLLLALPLAVAVWAFGGFAAKRERNNADQELVRDLNSGASVYARLLRDARHTADRLAGSRRVGRAFAQSDKHTLRAIEQAHPWIILLHGAAGGLQGRAVEARVDVIGRERTIGRVFVVPPFGRRLVRTIGDEADLPGGRLGFLLDHRLVRADGVGRIDSRPTAGKPADVRMQALEYRAVALPLREQRDAPVLITVRKRSEIAAAANDVRWRVIGLGLGLIGAFLVTAYAVAPAIARSRLSRLQRDQAQRVLARLGDGVLVVDHDGVVQLWNQAAETITGLRAAEVRGRRAEEAIPGWTTIATFVPVADRPGEADGPSSSETVPVDVAGRELWLSIVAVALDDDTVYAFRDATHDRRLEDLRSQFVATISHELRTPLASLHGAALTLREHDLPAQTQDDLLEMIAEQSNRLANLVEEILVAGQLDSGSLRVVADTFDPEELVRGVVTVARSRVGEDTMIEVVVPPVVPKAHGDGERTRQVLLNLLDNAIKYAPSEGRIEVGLAAVGDRLRFSVQDQGLGIPVGEQERIFDKFYRLDPDQRRGIGGTGLGLYICRELVRSMHGRIWVESERGKGTTFAFELPAEPLPVPV